MLSRYFFVLIKALVWCGVRGQLPLCTTYYGIIVRDEIWVGEHKWGSKKKRQSTIHWWTFFVFPSGTTAMAYKKLIQNALLEALHATIVLYTSYTRVSFWWCLTPLPLPIHMPHSITELKQQNLSHDSFRLRGLPREYVKKQFAYVTTYLLIWDPL